MHLTHLCRRLGKKTTIFSVFLERDCETIAIWGRWLFNQILTMYFNGWQQMRWSRCIITAHKKGISSIIDSQKCKPIKKLSFLPGIQALTSKQNFFLFVKFPFVILSILLLADEDFMATKCDWQRWSNILSPQGQSWYLSNLSHQQTGAVCVLQRK